MQAELIDWMGDDLRVVNAARVSFAKETEWEDVFEWSEEYQHDLHSEQLSEKDQKLLSYLAKHDHFTPFTHVMLTMRETVPIFVARQRFKHTIGFSYNEESRRYVSDDPTFFVPDVWREAAQNKKQGSGGPIHDDSLIKDWYDQHIADSAEFYRVLLDNGIAPEQARMVLPQSMYTSYYVTGSLAAWARAYKLRSDEHSQKEIQDLAAQWNDIISGIPEMKYSWKALTE